MKTLLLAFTLFISLCGVGQSIVKFPDSNAVWNYNYRAYCFGNGQANENYSVFISGDTTLNNLNYHKLNVTYVQSFSTGTCGGYALGYQGAFREDLNQKKVYFLPPNDSIEQLLYDYNLQVGDTVKGYLYYLDHDVVISIDSVLVGNSFRKRWLINNCYNISIIEGVGSTYGFFKRSPACYTGFPDFSLHCFQSDLQIKYPSNSIGCQIITNTKPNSNKSDLIYIFPNPSNGILYINSLKNVQSGKIFDVHGQLVGEFNSSIKRIVLPEEKGLYLVQVQTKKGEIYSEKIIRQ